MLEIPCDELMGMHPHEASSDIRHLVVVRDRMILSGTFDGQGVDILSKPLYRGRISHCCPICGSRPTSDLAVVMPQPVSGVGAFTNIDIEFIFPDWM